MTPNFDREMILRTWNTFRQPGEVLELRIPKAGRSKTISGYFNEPGKLADAVVGLADEHFAGIYFTINPVKPDLLARASNKYVKYAETTTNDADTVALHWLPIDLDAKRPAGISATDGEHEAAITKARKIRSWLPELHPVDYRFCANRYFPRINWMITGRCNYNCLHCFNAADNKRLQSEFSWEACVSLLGEAEKCGVHAFTITGGEPMLHPRFMDIVRSIYERNMMIDELNTNGAFITQPILDEMKHIRCRPLMKISFDGIGHHDWLRNQKGAEQRTLDAIKLCVANDFPVMVQTNIHRKNVDTILPTLELMDTLGVMCTRVIRTSESPRWLENAGDSCLAVEEYYEACLKIAGGYIKNPHAMSLAFWQFLDIFSKSRTYRMRPVVGCYAAYQPNTPVCCSNRGAVAITASGDLVPCNQISGLFKNKGISLGNVNEESLQQLLLDSMYLDTVCTPVSRILEHDEKCQRCAYWRLCLGGCRASAMVFNNNYLACDPAKCTYFHGGWMEKNAQALKDLTMLEPMIEIQ